MKTKPFWKDKTKITYISVAVVLVVALIGGGYYLSAKKGAELAKTPATTSPKPNTKTQQNASGKGQTGSQTSKPVATTTAPSTPSSTAGLALLGGVSIQASKDTIDQTMSLDLYGPEGTYDVDKCANYLNNQCQTSWTNLVINQTYPGYGGLAIDQWPSSETTATYIAYKVISNAKISASNPITVDANLVNDIKTFTEGE